MKYVDYLAVELKLAANAKEDIYQLLATEFNIERDVVKRICYRTLYTAVSIDDTKEEILEKCRKAIEETIR